MDIHPWTKYEIAHLRDEERLLRARAAMRAREVREESLSEVRTSSPKRTISWLDRIRGSLVERAPTGIR
jgi:hypothetical protein